MNAEFTNNNKIYANIRHLIYNKNFTDAKKIFMNEYITNDNKFSKQDIFDFYSCIGIINKISLNYDNKVTENEKNMEDQIFLLKIFEEIYPFSHETNIKCNMISMNNEKELREQYSLFCRNYM